MNETAAVTMESELEILKKAVFKATENESPGKKNPYHVVLLLSIFFGWMGLDRYYTGKTGTGLLKTISIGGLGIWWMIDILLLLFNRQTDVYGRKFDGVDEKDPTVLVLLTLGGIFHYFYLGMYRLGAIRFSLIFLIMLTSMFQLVQISFFLVLINSIWTGFDLFLVISGRITHDAKGAPVKSSDSKYQSIALVFSIIGGFIGLDRFYLGHRLLGMLKLFTFGGFFFWYILDLILIILNILKDVDGKPLIQE